MKKKRILFLSLTITTGGAERTLFNILKYLDRERFEPFVVYFDKRPDQSPEIPADVPLFLVQKKGIPGFIRIVLILAFKLYPKIRPDIVVGFLDFPNTVALLAKILSPKKHRVILTVHNNLTMLYQERRNSFLKTLAVMVLYRGADRIIAVSKGVKNDLAHTFHLPRRKLTFIYNAIDIGYIRQKTGEKIMSGFPKKGVKTIISCGRLCRQKNFHLLLTAFYFLIRRIPAHLFIIGEGSMKQSLMEHARKIYIDEFLTFLGYQENPFAYIARSDLFVLTSSYEGLGNVLIEAMICGVPVISTDCPFGPNEIIQDNKNGLLSVCERIEPNAPIVTKAHMMLAEMLSEAMYIVLGSSYCSNRLVYEAEKSVSLFSAPFIVEQYEKVFLE